MGNGTGDVAPKDVPPPKDVTPKAVKPDGGLSTDDADGCCCDALIVKLYSVKVVKKTSTFGVTATDDDVAITSLVEQPTGASGATWPPNEKYYALDTGETTSPKNQNYVLATIIPDHHCKLVGAVSITAWRVKMATDLKTVVNEIVGKAAAAAGSLSGLTQLSGAVEALSKDLYDAWSIATKPIGGQMRISISGIFSCDASLKSLIHGGMAGDLTDVNDQPLPDTATEGYLTFNLHGEGGDWIVKLLIERDCPDGDKKKKKK